MNCKVYSDTALLETKLIGFTSISLLYEEVSINSRTLQEKEACHD